MAPSTATLEQIRDDDRRPRVEFIFAQFVDMYGRPSAKLVPAAEPRRARRGRGGVCGIRRR